MSVLIRELVEKIGVLIQEFIMFLSVEIYSEKEQEVPINL